MSNRLACLVACLFYAAGTPALEFEFINVTPPPDEDAPDTHECISGTEYFPIFHWSTWAAIQSAAESWEEAFSDPITVRVAILHRSSAPGDVTMQSIKRIAVYPLADVKSALEVSATSDEEFGAYVGLPVPLQVYAPDPTGVVGTPTILEVDAVELSAANARALGLSLDALDSSDALLPQLEGMPGLDGAIIVNVPCGAHAFLDTYDVTPADGIGPGLADYQGLFEHELGHVLGFTSNVDREQEFRDIEALEEELAPLDLGRADPAALDLWRFPVSAPAAPDGIREFRQGAARFLDVYDGVAGYQGAEFSQGIRQFCYLDPGSFPPVGDAWCPLACGCGAGHWRNSETDAAGDALLLRPGIAPGTLATRREDDTRALDMIGYDSDSNAGFSLEGFSMRLAPTECADCWERLLVSHPPLGRVPKPIPDPSVTEDGDTYRVLGRFGLSGRQQRPGDLVGVIEVLPAETRRSYRGNVTESRWRRLAATLSSQLSASEVEDLLVIDEQLPYRLVGVDLQWLLNGNVVAELAATMPERGIGFDQTLGRYGGFSVGFRVTRRSEALNVPDGLLSVQLLADAPVRNGNFAQVGWSIDLAEPYNQYLPARFSTSRRP